MAVIGIGIDLVDIERVDRLLSGKGERALRRLFTERELAYVGARAHPIRHHAVRLADLPRIHGDPLDRILVAQALVEGLPLVTSDRRLPAYGIEVIW